jgi:hypothetical protein
MEILESAAFGNTFEFEVQLANSYCFKLLLSITFGPLPTSDCPAIFSPLRRDTPPPHGHR